MSWNKSYATKKQFDEDDPRYFTDSEGDADAVEAARKAAYMLIDSGAIGGPDKDFSVYIGGHSNPKHEPNPSYTNDCITVTIGQL